MTLNNTIKIACVSDIHLGHKNTKTSKIIENLRKAFFTDHSNKDLDIWFLAGDVFDGLLDLNDNDLPEIDFFIEDFLRYCSINNIAVRVLEGTPSHDWTQSQRFMTIAKILKLDNLDIQYIDNVYVEINEKYNISILYVPDEIQPTTDKTLKLVKDTLLSKGLDKVDIAIMHGQFDYQLPSHIKHLPRHSSEAYLELVKKVILIGHIHTFSTFDRIVAQGSFDRLTHGQEEPKGFVKVDIKTDSFDIHFIENKYSQLYKSFDIDSLTLEETIDYLDKTIKEYPVDSFVRLTALSTHPVFFNMKELIGRFPYITFSRLIKEKNGKQTAEQSEDLDINSSEYLPITLTKDNIPGLLKIKLNTKFDQNETMILKSMHLLQECL